MIIPWPLIIATGALILAAILYFVFLPHLEGPSLDEQLPDRKAWLVECPHCGHWQAVEPHVSTERNARLENLTTFVNRYECEACQQRWEEENKNRYY